MRAPSGLSDGEWPPDPVPVYLWRQQQLDIIRSDKTLMQGALAFYSTRPATFINHWVDTYDPRLADDPDLDPYLPFQLFRKQRLMVKFLRQCLQYETHGLIEKARDVGATWIAAAFSVWLWLYRPGAAIGWGSYKQDLVDQLGNPKSVFEKLRLLINRLPPEFLPVGFSPRLHMNQQKIINPANGASITGDVGDNIGRGDRTLIYFKDESAHYRHPELIEASLQATTRVQIDMSSVNGIGNVFYRKRMSGVEWTAKRGVIRRRINVFIVDWRDHPAKTEEWHREEKKLYQDQGLLHVFAQEVDRDYAASVEGVVIPAEWVQSAIDAHIKLGFDDSGRWVAGLDVADEGLDRNALVKRKGPILKSAKSWGERDTGATARRALHECSGLGAIDLQYDVIGVGSGVKAETNRLAADKKMPKGIRLTPWNAAASPLFPDDNIISGDLKSVLNKDYYANLKAQGWWELRKRFERTHRAIHEGIKYDPSDLISIPSSLPERRTLERELSQATASMGSKMKIVIDKAPEGTPSPNMADATVMAYWPANLGAYDETMDWVG